MNIVEGQNILNVQMVPVGETGLVYLENCEIYPFNIVADPWGGSVYYSSIITLNLTYRTDSQVPPEPSPLARLVFEVTLGGYGAQFSCPPINQIIGPFYFPTGTTVLGKQVIINYGNVLPFSSGEMVPYEVDVEALVDVSVGHEIFTGEVQCIGVQ